MIIYLKWLEKIGYSKKEILNMDSSVFDILLNEFLDLRLNHVDYAEAFRC